MRRWGLSNKVIKKTEYCKKCDKSSVKRLVKSGNYYSCTICTKNNSKKHRKNNWFKYLAQKANARKRPGSEYITEGQLITLYKHQENKCALTGKTLDVNSEWWKPSLDRIDSSTGYSRGNIRIVAWIVNHMKGKLTDEEFINACNHVASNYHKYPYVESTLIGGKCGD